MEIIWHFPNKLRVSPEDIYKQRRESYFLRFESQLLSPVPLPKQLTTPQGELETPYFLAPSPSLGVSCKGTSSFCEKLDQGSGRCVVGGKVREPAAAPHGNFSGGSSARAPGCITHFWKRLSIEKVRVGFKQQNVSVSPNRAVFKGHIRINQKVPGMRDPPPSIGVPARGGAGEQTLKPRKVGGHVAVFKA